MLLNMADAQNKKIGDRFIITKHLDSGAMGEVLKCRDATLDKEVAVKLLLPSASDETMTRFHNEAKAIAKLSHPNIVRINDFVLIENKLYLVMELIDGVSLSKMLSDTDFLDIDLSIEIIQQVCSGLAHAHKNSVIHRDIKPSNVLVSYDEQDKPKVKIVDFGIAKLQDSNQTTTKTGVAVGTPAYISPEAVQSKPVDVRSEVYSVGCMLYEMLTGKKPFVGNTSIDTMMMHVEEPAPRLSDTSPSEFGEDLEEIIAKCLMKSPAERFQTINELEDSLSNLYRDEIHDIQSDDQTEETNPKKSTIPILLGAVATIVIATLAAFSFVSINKEKHSDSIPLSDSSLSMEKAIIEDYDMPEPERVKLKDDSVHVSFANNADIREAADTFKSRSSWKFTACKFDNGASIKHIIEHPITKLTFQHCTLNKSLILELAKMKSLKSLSILNCDGLTSKDLAPLIKLPHLRDLQISDLNSASSVELFSQISQLNSLSTLEIHGIDLTKRDFQNIRKLKKLQTLSLKNVKIDKNANEQLVNLKINTLLSTKMRISSETSENLAKNTFIRRLFITEVSSSGEALINLAKLPNLETMKIKGCVVDSYTEKQILKAFRNCQFEALKRPGDHLQSDVDKLFQAQRPKLGKLNLYFPNINSNELPAYRRKIKSPKTATELKFENSELKEELKVFTDLPIRKLSFESCDITNKEMEYISLFPNLRSLSIKNVQPETITVEGYKHLLKIKRLKELGLKRLPLNEEVFEVVSKIPDLNYLNLVQSSGITSNGLAKLAKLEKLDTLKISFEKTANSDDLLAGIAKIKSLIFLWIEKGPPLSKAGLESLKLLPDLNELGISQTTLSDEQIQQLKKLPSLKRLAIISPYIEKSKLSNLKIRLEGIEIVQEKTKD